MVNNFQLQEWRKSHIALGYHTNVRFGTAPGRAYAPFKSKYWTRLRFMPVLYLHRDISTAPLLCMPLRPTNIVLYLKQKGFINVYWIIIHAEYFRWTGDKVRTTKMLQMQNLAALLERILYIRYTWLIFRSKVIFPAFMNTFQYISPPNSNTTLSCPSFFFGWVTWNLIDR